MAEECCHRIDPSVFFPYKRVIVGGKLKIYPLRDSEGNICGFDPSEVQETGDSNSICSCSQQTLPNLERFQCSNAPALPTIGEDSPITLTACVKKALVPTKEEECRHLITPLQRLTAGKEEVLKQQLRDRILHMERETEKVVYPTPMSSFRNDEKVLRKAIRHYKRDVQLQKERGVYKEKPKHFYDQDTEKWYNNMVKYGKPCLNRETQELVNKSDCVTFADAVGGSCFICPERKTPDVQN
ncbi:hypothetical protein RRG08_028117 [Elysia crispata]|uniref:Uncharacterized protein n=1 Tax=Elysia crispata TaxID=231223 RepID=A0AAE1A3H7_9GAST|nr:hypothetical protein RRG08_028117 [Elysia crispata]